MRRGEKGRRRHGRPDRAAQSDAGRGEGPGGPLSTTARARRAAARVGLVLLVALLLVGAAAGLVYIGRDHAAAYILVLLAALGVDRRLLRCSPWPPASCACPARDGGNPLLKTVVDNAADGILVTDQTGRVVLCQCRLSRPDRRRRRQRRAADRAGVHRRSGRFGSRSIGCSRRRAKAAGCRKRCASPAPSRRPARWLRLRVRPLGDGKRDAR